jgi:hypothetical protein
VRWNDMTPSEYRLQKARWEGDWCLAKSKAPLPQREGQ